MVNLNDLGKLFFDTLKIPYKTLLFVLGIIVGNLYVESDPLWGLIVGPSGRTKTEVVTPFKDIKNIISISRFHKESLVSGLSNGGKNKGFGLLQRLKEGEKYILLIKDFTTILAMHPEKMAETFSVLREVYDGEYSENYGNELGLVTWRGKVGILGGCTNAIDQAHSFQQKHGSRFLYWRVGSNDLQEDVQLAQHTLSKTGHEKEWRDQLRQAVNEFFGKLCMFDVEPKDSQDRIINMATLTAYARSYVSRNAYGGREIEDLPDKEAPTRLTKQLVVLGTALAMVSGEGRISDENFSVLAKTAIDSMPRVRVEVLKALSNTTGRVVDMSAKLNLPNTTITRTLEDLRALGLVEQDGGIWKLTPECETLIKGGGFTGPTEMWASISL